MDGVFQLFDGCGAVRRIRLAVGGLAVIAVAVPLVSGSLRSGLHGAVRTTFPRSGTMHAYAAFKVGFVAESASSSLKSQVGIFTGKFHAGLSTSARPSLQRSTLPTHP